MEKSVLQRLFGFLRDLSDQRKADPPSDGDPGDKRRPRLTAVEGGKGKGQWDGNERRKTSAVIGIPYSSDAADDTVEEEEESIMKHIAKYMFVFAAVAAAVFALSACGGGGGGGGGLGSSAAISAGTMTKGSVIVNGVKFTASAGATFRVDDNPSATEAQLRDGMEVKVKGQINNDGTTGQFEKVQAEPEVRGKIAGAPGADDFTVNGQHVITDDNTVFEDRVAGVFNKLNNGINDLLDTNEVEVHGGRDDLGNVRATRVERRDDNPENEVKGTVSGLPANPFTLTNGSTPILVNVTGGTTISPVKVPPLVLANTNFVEVHGTFDKATNTITATRIDIEDLEDAEFEPAQGQEFEVEGYVSGFTATPGTFEVGSQTVTTTSATTFRNGTAVDLDNSVKVEAEGHYDNVTKVLTATRIDFKRSRVILGGIPSVVNPDNVTLLGKTVKFTSATRNDSGTIDTTNRIEVRGYVDKSGTVVAERIKSLGGNRDIVQARVTGESGNVLTLLGYTADLTGISVSNLKDSKSGTYATLAAFLAAITPSSSTPPGTLVKVKGTVTGSAFATPPNEVEIEFED
jgi:hypothetical protein